LIRPAASTVRQLRNSMKTSVVCGFVLILFQCASLSAKRQCQAVQSVQNSQPFTEVDFRINGVGLGANYSTVKRVFGQSLALKRERVLDDTCGPPYTSLRLKYQGLDIRLEGSLRGQHFKVVSIEVKSPRLVVRHGLRIGMTENAVLSRLGKPAQERYEGSVRVVDYVTKGNDGGASLFFRSGKLIKIYWKYTLC
jgi:hypothetical protein